MNEIWKTLPGWMRNIVVPVIVLIVALWVVSAVVGAIFGIIGFLFGWIIKVLFVVALGAVVVILVKRASR
ncbi:hypothetical protein [Streptacidiphilus carbonis]|jgi:hypothetical protein|uniref:hypothetical protein n=1 Tax=Streptacidiphilus carbonis TaxID=105422 RepID=UPI0005A7D5B0|nr:hypothetical protein [Streptacidiphilus carbonis]